MNTEKFLKTENQKPHLSDVMIQLYGNKAQEVYDACQTADPWFNAYVQGFIYDVIWRLEPLSLREKSLVTISVLQTLKKETQLEIHLLGFYHLGGAKDDIQSLFDYLKNPKLLSASFSLREKAIIDLSKLISVADEDMTQRFMKLILDEKLLNQNDVAAVLRHAMTYAGCPCTMNGFAALNSVN